MFEKVEYLLYNEHEVKIKRVKSIKSTWELFIVWEIAKVNWGYIASNIAGPNNLVIWSKPNPQIQSQINTQKTPFFLIWKLREKK